jgi:hypothetical protein
MATKVTVAALQATQYCEKLKMVLMGVFLANRSPYSEAIACASMASTGPNARKSANVKAVEATISCTPLERANMIGRASHTMMSAMNSTSSGQRCPTGREPITSAHAPKPAVATTDSTTT